MPQRKPSDTPVTAGDCDRRHRNSWAFPSLIVAFLAVLIAVGGGAAISGTKAQHRLDVHEGKQTECIKHMNESLARIEELLKNK